MALTPETQRALMDMLKVKQPKSIAAPISPYEAIQMDKGLLSTDPVISKLQKVGRGVKSLLEPETSTDYLSMVVPGGKVASKVSSKIFPNAKKYNKYDPIIEINMPNKKNPYAKEMVQSTFQKRIPIDDFLKLTTTSDKNLQNIKSSKRLAELGKFDVEKAGIPFLEINKNGTVTSHEGRARALLAKYAGAKTIPVNLKLERFDPQTNDFEFTKIAQDFFNKNKKLPKDFKDYNINNLKPQKFSQGQRKNYQYNIKD